MDYSLRAFASVAFLYNKMKISICGKPLDAHNIVDTLTDVVRYNLRANEMGKKPVILTIGKSAFDKKKGLGGAHFYATNVLIASYVRQEIGLSSSQEGLGVLAIVHLDPREFETAHNKQQFRRPNHALEVIEERVGQAFVKYVNLGLEKKVLQKGKAAEVLASKMVALTDWLQCESCNRWRIVPQEYAHKFTGQDQKWYCWTEGSPVMKEGTTSATACQTPETALAADDDLVVDYQQGSKVRRSHQCIPLDKVISLTGSFHIRAVCVIYDSYRWTF